MMKHAFDWEILKWVNHRLIVYHGYDLRADYFFTGTFRGCYGLQSAPYLRSGDQRRSAVDDTAG